MLLYDVFIILCGHDLSEALLSKALPPASAQMFSAEALAFAKQKKNAAYRNLSQDLSTKPGELNALYDNFLIQCERLLMQTKAHLFPILPAALNTFEAPEYIDRCKALIAYALKEEENPAAIIPLGRQFIDNPNAFFGFIHWLMQQGVTPEQLLSTHLLQDYVRYYCSSLHAENNPVVFLHQKLEQSKPTKTLAQLMSQTRCREGELSNYALDGKIYAPTTLTSPEQHTPEFRFKATPENVTALTQLFDVRFLTNALSIQNLTTNERTQLEYLLNTTTLGQSLLPHVLKTIHESPIIKQNLASVLYPKTIDALLQTYTSGLLCLLPFSPHLSELIDVISLEALNTELEALKQHTDSHFDLVADLSALFSCFTKQKAPHAYIVYDVLLDALIEAPSLVEDVSLLQKLQRFKQGHDLIKQHIQRLEVQFSEGLAAQIHKDDAFDIISIEDMWRDLSRQLDALQLIDDIACAIPADKFALYASIAGEIIRQSNRPFDIAWFMHTLGLASTELSAVNDSLYERVLIELLVTFDNPYIRAQVISKLTEHVALYKPDWKTSAYSGSTLIKHAICHGNLGLIKWLNATPPTPVITKQTLNTFCIEAATLGHWHVANHFLKSFHLNRVTLNKLLDLAVTQRCTWILPSLWQRNKATPSRKDTEKAFLKTIQQADFASMHFLIRCKTAPSDTSLTRGFKQALNIKEYAIATEITVQATNNPCLQDAINQALIDAANKNDTRTLCFLRQIPPEIITQKTLDQALVRATKCRTLAAAQVVLHLFELKPRSSAKELALKQAKKKGFNDITNLLSQEVATGHTRKSIRPSASLPTIDMSEIQSPLTTSPMKNQRNRYGLFSPTLKIPSNAEALAEMPPPLQRQRSY